jgi:hypothetical protein
MPSQPVKYVVGNLLRSVHGQACDRVGVCPELQISRVEILIIYKTSTHRKKPGVKQVPAIRLAFATELQILPASKHLIAL